VSKDLEEGGSHTSHYSSGQITLIRIASNLDGIRTGHVSSTSLEADHYMTKAPRAVVEPASSSPDTTEFRHSTVSRESVYIIKLFVKLLARGRECNRLSCEERKCHSFLFDFVKVIVNENGQALSMQKKKL